MKINFAQVPDADVDNFGEDGLFGPDQAGNFYYNFVEYGTNPGGDEELAINDGCNRFIPISMEHVPELISALAECYKIYVGLRSAETIKEIVESDGEGYVYNNKVTYDTESFSESSSWPFPH